MRYALSNRQLKELANGKLLRIVLPIPEQPADDWIAWARQSLEVAPQYVRRAVQADVWCAAHRDSDHAIEAQLGRILKDSDEPYFGAIPYSIAVIQVELCARDEPRGKYPPAWPAKIVKED